VQCNGLKPCALGLKQYAELGCADARRLLQHGFEHRLQLAGQAGDDAQHLGGRGLLLQGLGKVPSRLGKFAGARFELLFQLDQ
jgi:hypothetical protein